MSEKKFMKAPNNLIFTYQTFCKGAIDLADDFFHAFLHDHLSQYDAWFNVKDDFLIFGVGVREPEMMKMYHPQFILFLNSQFNAEIEFYVREEVGIMPSILQGCPVDLGKGRVLFAGEGQISLIPWEKGYLAL